MCDIDEILTRSCLSDTTSSFDDVLQKIFAIFPHLVGVVFKQLVEAHLVNVVFIKLVGLKRKMMNYELKSC